MILLEEYIHVYIDVNLWCYYGNEAIRHCEARYFSR